MRRIRFFFGVLQNFNLGVENGTQGRQMTMGNFSLGTIVFLSLWWLSPMLIPM